ncbi:MAG: GAF domain-containing protein [Polyangiaceae bacterium]
MSFRPRRPTDPPHSGDKARRPSSAPAGSEAVETLEGYAADITQPLVLPNLPDIDPYGSEPPGEVFAAYESSAPPRRPSRPSINAVRVRELEAELKHERGVSGALREVGLAIGKNPDPSELLALILQRMVEILEADRVTLYLREEESGELVSRITTGDMVQSIRLKVGQGIAGDVAATGERAIVRDAYEDPRFSPQWDLQSGYRTRSVVAVPILDHEGNVLGVAQALNKEGDRDFTEDDANMLSALAVQASVSMENLRLLQSLHKANQELVNTKMQLEHRVRDLKLLFDLERAMARVSSVDELLASVLGEAQRVLDAELAAFALKDPGTLAWTIHVLGSDGHIERYPMQEGEGIIGAALTSDRAIRVDDARSDPRHSEDMDRRVGIVTHSALCVPLEGDDEPIGALGLYNKRGGVAESRAGFRAFDEEDQGLLLLLSANASTAIQLHWARESREREERLTTIGRLLSGVLHDLKTPLGVINGYVELMRTADKKAQRAEYADLVLKQFAHIGAMQRDVLEFARGEKSILPRKVYLAQFFEEVKATLETFLAKAKVELVIDLADRGTARFDEGKILRVIQNLARNAAEAMAPKGGGKFTIRVTRSPEIAASDRSRKDVSATKTPKPEELVLTFSDTGPGIPKEIQHRLFQSFVTSGKKGGTGLGLAIVKRIAEEHGGKVTVTSSSKGATFTVRLPQTKESAA